MVKTLLMVKTSEAGTYKDGNTSRCAPCSAAAFSPRGSTNASACVLPACLDVVSRGMSASFGCAYTEIGLKLNPKP